MIRGEVHDENAWSLGGVAGHAGLFSTARDLAVLARTLLNGGRYGDARILDEDTVRAMLVNENTEFPGQLARSRLRARPALVHGRPVHAGHLRAHRLHGDVGGDRPAVGLVRHPAHQPGAPVARLGQQQPGPACGRARPGPGDRGTAARGRHRVVLRRRRRPHGLADDAGDARAGALSFGLWYDTEAGFDEVTLEASTDGGDDLVAAAVHAPLAATPSPPTAPLSGLRRPGLAPRDRALPGPTRAGALALRQRRGQPGPRRLRRPRAGRRLAGSTTAGSPRRGGTRRRTERGRASGPADGGRASRATEARGRDRRVET